MGNLPRSVQKEERRTLSEVSVGITTMANDSAAERKGKSRSSLSGEQQREKSKADARWTKSAWEEETEEETAARLVEMNVHARAAREEETEEETAARLVKRR